eukprot:56302-Pelagomonas_calceolata.AAC.3
MVKIDQCAQYCSQHQYMRLCGQQATTGVARVVKSGLVCTILSTASVVWATGLPQKWAFIAKPALLAWRGGQLRGLQERSVLHDTSTVGNEVGSDAARSCAGKHGNIIAC